VNVKRVERIWLLEGLKVPQKQPKKGRLWLNDGSCLRLRPEHPNHVWSYHFVEDRTAARHRVAPGRHHRLTALAGTDALGDAVDEEVTVTVALKMLELYRPLLAVH
jgi:hypothetical protein